MGRIIASTDGAVALDLSGCQLHPVGSVALNTSERPNDAVRVELKEVVTPDAEESFFISPAGCRGILRRRQERRLSINGRLRSVLESISSEWSDEQIEVVSRKQRRGRFSVPIPEQGTLLDESFA